MANPSWPGTLPAYVLEQGYSEQVADQLLETQMDAGSAKTRRRYTRNNRVFTVEIAMDETQSQSFETFFDTTLAGGSLAFDWLHPRRRTTMTFKFRHPVPKLVEVNGSKRVWQCALEALTDPV